MSADNSFKSSLQVYCERVDEHLNHWLPEPRGPEARLQEAMRYSVVGGGGKRVRPVLVYAAGQALNVELEQLDACACAVEIIHAYSLIHDDLPAMDDDDLRRGRPTCHRAFDEATAILAGDALQAVAFEILAADEKLHTSPANRIEMIKLLAQASGSMGMAGGQAIDLAAVGQSLNLDQLENMHLLKTGALIRASVVLGGLCNPEITAAELEMLDSYAQCVGLCFQIQDDILDVIGDTETLGKPQGSDQERDKPTYPAILGLEAAKQLAQEQHDQAISYIAHLGDRADTLRQIADYIIERDN